MKTIETTIRADYLTGKRGSAWGLDEGIRDFLQNAKDAEVEFSAPMSVRVRGNTLVIENDGCTLPLEAILLGHTTKKDRADLIGQYGEGLKISSLALIRAGHEVKIRNGDSVWIPKIVKSKTFDAEVLAFEIHTGRKNENRVQVEIEGVTPDYFKDHVKPRFLWLDKDGRRKDEEVVTPHGTILRGERFQGKIFVKGIWVETKPELTVGYDFPNADVDRDRKMIRSFDLQWYSRQIWTHALGQRPDLFSQFHSILAANSQEAQLLDEHSAKSLPDEFLRHSVAEFRKQFGLNAIPVSNLAEGKELEHFGKIGVTVPPGLRAVLESQMGTLDSVREALRNEVVRTYSYYELTAEQKSNLDRALSLVNLAFPTDPVQLDDISVVDFRSENLLGLHSERAVKLAGKVVADRAKCLRALVHEVAHNKGDDGEKSHVSEIERIWSIIAEHLSGGVS